MPRRTPPSRRRARESRRAGQQGQRPHSLLGRSAAIPFNNLSGDVNSEKAPHRRGLMRGLSVDLHAIRDEVRTEIDEGLEEEAGPERYVDPKSKERNEDERAIACRGCNSLRPRPDDSWPSRG